MGKRAIESKQAKPSIGSKPKRRRVESFSIYIYKILKQVHTGLTMSKKAMSIINSFVYDTFDKIATEAAKLVKLSRAKTLKIRDVRSAVKLILPGEVGRHAVSEGNRTIMFKYKQQYQ